MNLVANQMVATMVSADLNAVKHTQPAKGAPGEFSKVLEKVGGEEGKTGVTTEKTETKTVKVKDEVTKENPTEPTKDAKSEHVEVVEKKAVEQTKNPATEATLEEAVEAVMLAVSELLGISLEALQSTFEKAQMTLSDLNDGGKRLELIQSVFGYEDLGTLLTDVEGTTALKEVTALMNQFMEEQGMATEELAAMLQQSAGESQGSVGASETKGQEAQPTEPVASEGVKGPEVEVVDLREGKATAQNKGETPQSGQQQNSQTFGEMIGQQLAAVRETVQKGSVENTVSEFRQISTSEVIDQIVTKAIINLSDEKTSMQMQLNPNHLGKVGVSVTAEQGIIKGQFVAENQVVKEMLEANLTQLKSQLEEQGIKVDKIEVALSNGTDYFDQKEKQQQEPSSQKNKRSKIGRISRLMQMEEGEIITAEERQPVQQTSLDVHTVEYSA